MRAGTRAALAVALLAGATTAGFSATSKDDSAPAKDTVSLASRSFDDVVAKTFVSIEGSTIALMPFEGGLAREVVALNGTAQKSLLTFINDKLGMVSNANDTTRVIGVFRTMDAGIEI